MADRTIDQLHIDAPQTLIPGVKIPTQTSGVTGAVEFDDIDADQLKVDYAPENYTPATVTEIAPTTRDLAAHLKGIDAKVGNGCALACGYEAEHYEATGPTIGGQFAGVDAALGDLAAAIDEIEVGEGLGEGVAVEEGDLVLKGLDLVVTTGGETPTVTYRVAAADGSVTQAGTVKTDAVGSAAAPSLSVADGEDAVGIYRPSAGQLGIAAGEKAVILDGGEAAVLRPATDALLSLGTEAVRWATAWAQTVRASAGLILGTGTSGDKAISIYQSESSASGEAGIAKLYTRAVEGVAHLFARGGSGDEVQLTGVAPSGGGPSNVIVLDADTEDSWEISDAEISGGVHGRVFRVVGDYYYHTELVIRGAAEGSVAFVEVVGYVYVALIAGASPVTVIDFGVPSGGDYLPGGDVQPSVGLPRGLGIVWGPAGSPQPVTIYGAD